MREKDRKAPRRPLRLLMFLFPPGRPFRWALPVCLLAGLLLIQVQQPGWAARVEGWTLDARFQLRGPQASPLPIVIVALDETSFQMLGDLQGENIRTWPRGRWAQLIERLAAGKPRLIAIDVVFDTPGWDPGGDAALAQALQAAGNVVLAAHLEYAATPGAARLTYSPPYAPLAAAAAGAGAVNLPADVDGAVRRFQPLWPWSGQTQPAFALVVASLYAGEPLNIPRKALAADFSLPLNYRGPQGAFRTVSMYDVWSGEAPADLFQDAIVLVGYTTQLEQDRHPAPFAGRGGLAGVEIQATTVHTLLARDWLQRTSPRTDLLLLAAAGLLALLAAGLPRAGWGGLALVGGGLIYLAVGGLLFARANFWLPLAAPLASAALTGLAAFSERLAFAEREKRLLRRRFAGMMSPDRLQAVLDNWEALLDPDRPEKEAAVLFADLRGFTQASEILSRQGRSAEMVRFLNVYFDRMAEAVFQEGGVVYRTFGDGLLILFGLPAALPDHPLRAVRGAVRMALAARELQAVWPLPEECPFNLGIGLNDGPMLDAIVGRGRRFDYTVLGDAVNAAARIESYCKEVMDLPSPPGGQVPPGVTILIGHALYQKVRSQVIADESIPPFSARGKRDPVQVVRLLGIKGGMA